MPYLCERPVAEIRQQVVALIAADRAGALNGELPEEMVAALGHVINCRLGYTSTVWPGMTAEQLQEATAEVASRYGAEIIGQASEALTFAVRLFLALAERYAEDFPAADIDGFLREAGLVAATEDPG